MFYVTAGRGTESFVENEIRSKLSAHILSFSNEELTRDGKIFFTFDDCSFNMEELFELKTVERIFVAIANYKNIDFIRGKKLFLDKLMDQVACQENYSFAQHVLKQLMSLSSNLQNKRVKTKVKESESVIEPVSKKARLQTQVKDCDNDIDDEISMKHGPPEKSDNHFDSSSVDCDPENKVIHNKSHCNTLEGDLECDVSFRLSIRCSGRIRRWLNFKKLSQDLSWRVVKATGWKVDLPSPMYEICLHISDQFVTIGIPLTQRPLSCRNYILDPGLRGPIAWIMTQLAEIQTGDMILDPMCGKGTLLLESCSELQEVIYVGVDNDVQQLASAMKNAKSAGFERHIHFLQADALSLPFKSCTVNAVVCDVPFNQKYFTSFDEDKFFVSFLSEMMRVLQEDGNLVILTSERQNEKVISASQETKLACFKCSNEDEDCCSSSTSKSKKIYLKLMSKHNVKLGETLATITVLKKTFIE